MATEPKSTVHANGIRTFIVRGSESCTVGVGIRPRGGNTQFLLARPDIEKPDQEDKWHGTRLWTILSCQFQEYPVQPPDSRGRHSFWMKTFSENEGLLEQMMEDGIIEVLAPIIRQDFEDFPLVRFLIPASEMMKQCGGCGKWEQVADENRLMACGKCKEDYQVYYCNVECQLANWKRGFPAAHKKLCGKEWD